MKRRKRCECGCGKFTNIATMTCSRLGHVRGQPVRFLPGHNIKLREPWNKGKPGISGPEHGSFKHGMAGTPEYQAFKNAEYRCTNPKHDFWADYGGRGIKFLFMSFEQWYNELGPRPSPAHSVDRMDNDGHYEPGNIRWATQEEQHANRRTRRKENVSEN